MFTLKQKHRANTATQRPLQLYNTLTRTQESFTPLKPGVVRMYNCGPTVYNYAHIGNLRSFVFADVLKRTLQYNGYRVRQVINMTDVGHLSGENAGNADAGEDKMTKALDRDGLAHTLENMQAVGQRYADAFQADLTALGVDVRGTQFPHASAYVEAQIAMIQTLEEKGYTYTTDDGVYFDTSRFPNYGKLGNLDPDAQQAGARINTNDQKRQQTDFALWKRSNTIGWDSPFGCGFPGWHIECSAMIMELLGKRIDIHTGGEDLAGVHHNNEIAQTESVTGKPLANYWLHSAFVSIESQKIAKSVGNTVFLYHLTERGYAPLAYRYWLLTAHYRTPVNFTWDALDAAQTAHRRLLRTFVEDLPASGGTADTQYVQALTAAVHDDLNTPQAIALVWELLKDDQVSSADTRATLLHFDRVLGLGLADARTQLQRESRKLDVADVEGSVQELVRRREAARQDRDFTTADALRDQIQAHGYDVVDTANGPTLQRR